MHGHKESYKDLNLKILTSEWDSNGSRRDFWLVPKNVPCQNIYQKYRSPHDA